MRAKVFRHIQRMPLAFFTPTQTGALVSRLNNDVIGAQQAFTDLLSNVVGNLVTVLIVVGVMFFLSWQITLAALVLVPLFLLPARFVGQRIGSLTKEGYNLNSEMNMVMQERFQVGGAMLVKLMGRPEVEAETFEAKAGRVRDIGIAQATYARVFFVALTLTASLATAIVYGVGGVAAVHGTLAVGTVVALTELPDPPLPTTDPALEPESRVMTALVSFERLFEVLDIVPMIAEAPDAVPSPAATPRSSSTTSASPTRAQRRSPSPHSNRSPSSRAAAQRGPPRRLVHRRARADGRPGRPLRRRQDHDLVAGPSPLRRHPRRRAHQRHRRPPGRQRPPSDTVGVVTQDPHLFHDTLRANLMYARPEATEAEVVEALDQAQIGHIVADLPDGLDTVIGERGYRLSGGEKQRVALARLLLKAPDIVVLDEATAHLDSESEAAVQRALRETLAGRTSLVIAHRLSTVREADELLVVDDGRIVERGTHASLLAENGLYAELYRTQFADQEAEPVAGSGTPSDKRLSRSGAGPRPAAPPPG